MNNEWFTVYSVIEEDDWDVMVWSFYSEDEARKFAFAKFEEEAKNWQFDTAEDVEDAWYSIDVDNCNFRMDWYYLYIKKTNVFNHNLYDNEGTKEFRGDTKRSRQEDRITPWDWWEA